MISNSVNQRIRRDSAAKIVPTTDVGGRKTITASRQVEPIYNDNDDVESAPRQPSPPQQKVLRPVRRRSSINRTRESIMRLLKDQGEQPKPIKSNRRTIVDSMLSPVDWLVDPVGDTIQAEEDIHTQIWEHNQLVKQTPRPWYIILPQSRGRLTWEFFMACLLSIMAFYIPFRVCFYWNEDVEPRSIFLFELCLDSVYGLDIIFNFITAYTEKELLITNPRKIATRYLKGFFLVDLIATIPFGTILQASPLAIGSKMGKLGRLPKMIRFAKAARLLKLLRVYKLHEFIMNVEIQFNVHHGISRMVKIVILILLITHLVACFWFLIGFSGGEGEINGGWVYRYFLDKSPIPHQYTASMYWAFSTLTTVGYGDISARTPQEQIYAMVMMLVGVSWYAYIVSSMSSIMNSFDAQNKAIREKMTCVNEFVRAAKLPKDLAKQVRDFYEFKLARSQHSFLMSSNYDVDELLDELGSGLRADVLLYMDRNLISAIPFLQNKVPQFVADCISMFQPMVFQADDYICKENTQADEMYFLVKGRAGIYYGSKLVHVLEEGSYFGEIGCIMGGIRRAGVKAMQLCELQALSRRNLNILLGEYPEVGEELKRVARKRASVKKGHSNKVTSGESIVVESKDDGEKEEAKSSKDESSQEVHESIGTTAPQQVNSESSSALPQPSTSTIDDQIDIMVKIFAEKLRQDFSKSYTSTRIDSQNDDNGIT